MNSIWTFLDANSRVNFAQKFEIKESANSIFAACKGTRTRKRAKNTFSREQAGTCSTYIATKRWTNSRLTCVCKSRNMY